MMRSIAVTAKDESIYLPVMAEVSKVEQVTALEKVFTLKLPVGYSLGNAPGQFVEVSLLGIGEAPISISSSPSRSNGTFELCVRQAGDLTNAMHHLEPGQELGIRGPFGHGFPIDNMKGKDMLFVAGGLGLAPLSAACRVLVANTVPGKRFRSICEVAVRFRLTCEWEVSWICVGRPIGAAPEVPSRRSP